MHARNLLPADVTDAAVIDAVDRWAKLLEAEQYDKAYSAVEQDPSRQWTPELLRQVIKQYGNAEIGQKVTVEGKSTDIIQRKDVHRFGKNQYGYIGYVWYDLNINGIVSDLTATFDIRDEPEGISLVLDDIHVM